MTGCVALQRARSGAQSLQKLVLKPTAARKERIEGGTEIMSFSARLKLAPIAALAVLIAAAPQALAQDKTVDLKLSHWVPPTHPLQKAMEDWGQSLEKASNGTIKFKIFPSQQLGKAFDHYDMARDGIADLVYVNPGYQPGRSRLSPLANCRSWSATPRAASARSTPGIANTPRPR
jgi:TRAP-type mannitol/chloroaromatic compound transport system substrate-binding protein